MRSLFLFLYVFPFVVDALEAMKDLAEDFAEASDVEGDVKRSLIITAFRDALDDHADEIPGWSAIGEDARDRILEGLAEIAYTIACKLSPEEPAPTSGKEKRRAAKKARTISRLAITRATNLARASAIKIGLIEA